jgi:hypothetical protein
MKKVVLAVKKFKLILFIILLAVLTISARKYNQYSFIIKDINNNKILDTISIRNDSLVLILDSEIRKKYLAPFYYEKIKLIDSNVKNNFFIENLYDEKQKTTVLYNFKYDNKTLIIKSIIVKITQRDAYGNPLKNKIVKKIIDKEYKGGDYEKLIDELF